MGKLLTITHQSQFRSSIGQNRIYPQIKVGSVSLTFITLIIIALLSLLYLAFSNQLAGRGYELRRLEEKKAILSEEIERLEVESSRLQSLKAVEEAVKQNKLVPTQSKVNYIIKKQNSMAAR